MKASEEKRAKLARGDREDGRNWGFHLSFFEGKGYTRMKKKKGEEMRQILLTG